MYKVTGGDTFSSGWRLPSSASAGLTAMCWLGEYEVTADTADSEAGLLLGDVRWTSPVP